MHEFIDISFLRKIPSWIGMEYSNIARNELRAARVLLAEEDHEDLLNRLEGDSA